MLLSRFWTITWIIFTWISHCVCLGFSLFPKSFMHPSVLPIKSHVWVKINPYDLLYSPVQATVTVLHITVKLLYLAWGTDCAASGPMLCANPVTLWCLIHSLFMYLRYRLSNYACTRTHMQRTICYNFIWTPAVYEPPCWQKYYPTTSMFTLLCCNQKCMNNSMASAW